jgi:hypothetical protein
LRGALGWNEEGEETLSKKRQRVSFDAIERRVGAQFVIGGLKGKG